MQLVKGQKKKLAELTGSDRISVGIGAEASGLSFDLSCFGLDEQDRLSDDRYFIFYNQKLSPEGAIAARGRSGPDAEVFELELGRLPSNVRKLAFVITADGNAAMSRLDRGHFRIFDGSGEHARYDLRGSDFSTERAVISSVRNPALLM